MSTAFLLNLDPDDGALCRLSFTQPPTGVSVSATTDQLFITDQTGFYEFASAEGVLSYEWHSGDRYFPQPENFGAGIVDAVGAATMDVIADGVVRATVNVQDYTSFRLPPGDPAYLWSVRLTGPATIREIVLARSFMEIKHA